MFSPFSETLRSVSFWEISVKHCDLILSRGALANIVEFDALKLIKKYVYRKSKLSYYINICVSVCMAVCLYCTQIKSLLTIISNTQTSTALSEFILGIVWQALYAADFPIKFLHQVLAWGSVIAIGTDLYIDWRLLFERAYSFDL